jgi:LmbE family N-acetylglucosaminyl deacetylase
MDKSLSRIRPIQEASMDMAKLRILVIGAHPDDPDVLCGGLAIMYSSRGHHVKFLSLTNGDTGHQSIGGIELARRRHAEAQASAAVAGIGEYQVLDNHSGELESSIANRKQVIRCIREYRPDLIITHRPNDYHPDHRATSVLVMDASYIVTVPNMQPLTDFLPRPPRICYMFDRFRKPNPFTPDVIVPIDEVVDRKAAMLSCHGSQMFEWMPFNQGILDQVPVDEAKRPSWLVDKLLSSYFAGMRDDLGEALVAMYGAQRALSIRYVEAFEFCEYGAGLRAADIHSLFPFLPADKRHG